MTRFPRSIAPAAALILALLPNGVSAAPEPLQAQVQALLLAAGPGPRYGLVVAGEDGREVVAIDPDGRYIPASNTKMFTTAAVFANLAVDAPDTVGGAAVRLEPAAHGAPDVVLVGNGDARLSGKPDCVSDCLAALADAVAAKTRKVRDVIGDDTRFPDQRWSPGMSWNNIPTKSGTATSALTLDDNEAALVVTPGAVGAAPTLAGLTYYSVDNRAVTGAAGSAMTLDFDREPNGYVLHLSGAIPAGAAPETLALGIDDPARYAAWRLLSMLEARGVKVGGTVKVRHRLLAPAGAACGEVVPLPPAAPACAGRQTSVPVPVPLPALARLNPAPLAADLTLINKVSQNLHAELMLRRLGALNGSGSIADGQVLVAAMLARAGVPRVAYDFSDGSGMSSYNRVAPRGVVTLLRWIALQPWGAAWAATLPIGAVDGSLAHRFAGTVLAGRIFAKTGTLNASSALAGYLIGRSGRRLTFASYAGDIPEGVPARAAVDAALVLIAEAN